MEKLKTIVRLLKNIWLDPVFSKVIAGGLLFVFASFLYSLKDRIEYLQGTTTIRNYVLVLFALVSVILVTWFSVRLVRAIWAKFVKPVTKDPQYQIVCTNQERFPIYYEDHIPKLDRVPTQLTNNREFALTAKFHLSAYDGITNLNVKAIVSLTHSSDPSDLFISNGVWLNSGAESIKFTPGGFAQLILGIHKGRNLYLCEREYIYHNGADGRLVPGHEVSIVVELVGSKDGIVMNTQKFVFSVVLEPEFNFNIVSGKRL